MGTKETQYSIEGGNIVYIRFISENKPCDRAIGKLTNTVTSGESHQIHLENLINLDTEEFLDAFTYKNARGGISILEDGELKDWYLEKVKQMQQG